MQQESEAEIPVTSISERLAASDRTVCADPDVQGTALGALVTADVLENFKAVGGSIDFDAVSAKGSNPQLAEVTCSAYLELLGTRFELTYAVRPAADDENEYVVQSSIPFSSADLNPAFELATTRLKWKIFEAGGPEAEALELTPIQRSIFEARLRAKRRREQEGSALPQVEVTSEGDDSAATPDPTPVADVTAEEPGSSVAGD